MKFKKTVMTYSAVLFAVLFMCAACFGIIPTAVSGGTDVSFKTGRKVVVSNDPHYSETVYYYDYETYIKYHPNDTVQTSSGNSGYHFVSATEKTVYVGESIEDGQVTDSRLLTDAERRSVLDHIPLDNDTQSHYALTLIMYVVLEMSSSDIILYGKADWSSELIWGGAENPEDSVDDYMGLAWSGGMIAYDYDAEEEKRPVFDGKCTDGSAISTYYNPVRNFGGEIGWQFAERLGAFNGIMQTANCYVRIPYAQWKGDKEKVNESMTFTYVHTWSVGAPIDISFGIGIPPSFNINFGMGNADLRSWQLQVGTSLII